MLGYSAQYKLMDLFHGCIHPTYQLIEAHSHLLQLFAPKEIQELLNQHFTITINGDPSKREDWDFILEMINKQTKSWMPNGVPSELLWTNACRNAEKLKFIKESLYTMLDMEKPNDASYRRIDIKEAIDMWRACLQSKKYLTS